jgi:catechol 2,3-dioxygenase-like lactoylglutathione lyase family enzyme
MDITIHASFLPLDDPEASLAFYRDTLGFEVRLDVGTGAMRWITVGCSSLGTFSTRFTELVGVAPSVYRRQYADATEGMPSCVATQVTRPVRNREVPAPAHR